jgi:hypothetical protein
MTMKKKIKAKKKDVFKMVARVYDLKGYYSFLVKVPVIIETVPEVPDVIICEKWAATLISTSPLAYRNVTSAKAKKVL